MSVYAIAYIIATIACFSWYVLFCCVNLATLRAKREAERLKDLPMEFWDEDELLAEFKRAGILDDEEDKGEWVPPYDATIIRAVLRGELYSSGFDPPKTCCKRYVDCRSCPLSEPAAPFYGPTRVDPTLRNCVVYELDNKSDEPTTVVLFWRAKDS